MGKERKDLDAFARKLDELAQNADVTAITQLISDGLKTFNKDIRNRIFFRLYILPLSAEAKIGFLLEGLRDKQVEVYTEALKAANHLSRQEEIDPQLRKHLGQLLDLAPSLETGTRSTGKTKLSGRQTYQRVADHSQAYDAAERSFLALLKKDVQPV